MFIFVPCLLCHESFAFSLGTYSFLHWRPPMCKYQYKELTTILSCLFVSSWLLIPGDQGDFKICCSLSTSCVIGTWLRYLLGAYSLLGTVLRTGGAISISELFDFSTALDALYHIVKCIYIECKVQIFLARKWREGYEPKVGQTFQVIVHSLWSHHNLHRNIRAYT